MAASRSLLRERMRWFSGSSMSTNIGIGEVTEGSFSDSSEGVSFALPPTDARGFRSRLISPLPWTTVHSGTLAEPEMVMPEQILLCSPMRAPGRRVAWDSMME